MQTQAGKRTLTVAGVFDQVVLCLLIPTQSGEMERVAVRFKERFQIKERVKELLSFSSSAVKIISFFV